VKQRLIPMLLVLVITAGTLSAQKPKKQMYMPDDPVPVKLKTDSRIDNMAYWRRMASLGLVPVEQEHKAPVGIYKSSRLTGRGSMTDDSPDVPVTSATSTQSENSIFVNPANPAMVLNSNNSTDRPMTTVYGANSFMSEDSGDNWDGQLQGAGGQNSGDPTTAIGLNGWYYVGYIHSSGGQGISYSTDQGNTWTPVLVAPSPGGYSSLLDKNHMWIDNSITSPHEGNLYDAWTNFGGANDTEIEISRSTDQGLTWSASVNISSAINAGSHNQGVNIHTGPLGEVYAIWAIYDNWPTDENAIGMARSFNGGASWLPATRIISNIRGIRNSGTSKDMRVNAFPSMAVDISNGPNRGTIYVVWPNIGFPGINTGNDMDVYMIRSTDQGATWSAPVRVNQDPAGLGKQHYFPWITCDPVNGNLSVVYYDDRAVQASQCEVYVSTSNDGGDTWEDMRVSDVAFTPSPIPNLAGGYFGDYLGIHSYDRWVYPVWTDNRTGHAMTYVSAFRSGPPPNQPWVIFHSKQINDVAGNGNSLFDFGETILLDISLENIGDQPASAVTATLSTENPYVVINDNTEFFGDVATGEIKAVAGAYSITAAQDIPDAETVVFTITATDANDSTFVSNFTLEAHAPSLQVLGMTINDAGGSANGRLDPGETATLNFLTFNPGDYTTSNVTATLTTTSPYLTITETGIELGDVLPGQLNAVTAAFEVTVSPETPIGHAAILSYTVTGDYVTVSKTFPSPVGLILEDWESGGFSQFDWASAGSAPWVIATDQVYEGDNSVKSGAIGNNATSELKITYNVMNNDTISFFLKVSSEADYDFLKFYIGNTMVGQWSGEQDWVQVKFAVTPGEKTFRWVYSKDWYVVGGSDCAWVDYIIFPAPLQTTAYAGADAAVCAGESLFLNGSATNVATVAWSTQGDGTFEDATQLSTFYFPGEQDISAGAVVLTLTVNGPEGQVISDNMNLSISTPATVSAGPELEACQGSLVSVSGMAENYTEVVWTTSGDGTFADPASLSTEYIPGTDDNTAGMVVLTLTAFAASPCAEVSAETVLTLLPLPSATLQGDTSVCQGSPVILDISLSGTPPWILEIEGYGSLTTTDPLTLLSLTPETTSQFSVTSVSDANGCSASGTGVFSVIANELPYVYLPADTIACANHTVALTAVTSGEVSYLWSPGGYTTQTILVDTTGTGIGTAVYSVLITDVNQCSSEASVNLTFSPCTGTAQEYDAGFFVYPNPSAGIFGIRPGIAVDGQYELTIRDASGKIVHRTNALKLNTGSVSPVNASGLPSGNYLMQLKGEKGVHSLKLLIEK